MLYILFGSTGEMGQWSRNYLQEKGLILIQKYNYVPDGIVLHEWFGKRVRVFKEEVQRCDFVYERNGILIGFNKDQILDAVRGRSQCLMTTTASTVDMGPKRMAIKKKRLC